MSTLTIEVDDELLARAEAASRASGLDVRAELVSRLEELAAEKPSRQHEAMQRFVARAEARSYSLEGGMPDRDERNARR